MVKVCEYRDIPEGDPRSSEYLIAEAPSLLSTRRIIRLVEISEGWACAGSMARWDEHCYGVLFNEDGARHGRRMKSREDAESLFEKWTGEKATVVEDDPMDDYCYVGSRHHY